MGDSGDEVLAAVRKIDPQGVKSNFVAALDKISESLTKVKSSSLPDATKKMVAESSLLSATVLWEGFVTDLFVAYINRDASRLASSFQTRVAESVKSKFGTLVSQRVKVSFPKHMREKDVRTVLDPKEYNLSFGSGADMQQRAADYLATAHAASFGALAASDVASIDAWLGIRNFLAHRSRSSEDRMNDALKAAAVPDHLRRNKHRVKDVGAFLKAVRPPAEEWRVENYIKAMKAIAQKL